MCHFPEQITLSLEDLFWLRANSAKIADRCSGFIQEEMGGDCNKNGDL